jgi:hypothetical protein
MQLRKVRTVQPLISLRDRALVFSKEILGTEATLASKETLGIEKIGSSKGKRCVSSLISDRINISF